MIFLGSISTTSSSEQNETDFSRDSLFELIYLSATIVAAFAGCFLITITFGRFLITPLSYVKKKFIYTLFVSFISKLSFTLIGDFFKMPEKTSGFFLIIISSSSALSSSSICFSPNLANTDDEVFCALPLPLSDDTDEIRIVFDGSVTLGLDDIIIDGLSVGTVRLIRLKMSFLTSLSAYTEKQKWFY